MKYDGSGARHTGHAIGALPDCMIGNPFSSDALLEFAGRKFPVLTLCLPWQIREYGPKREKPMIQDVNQGLFYGLRGPAAAFTEHEPAISLTQKFKKTGNGLSAELSSTRRRLI